MFSWAPARIGLAVSVEFDLVLRQCLADSRRLGYRSILLNFNPKIVSTDYDECDRLYFDEINIETVQEIYRRERCIGVIVSVGAKHRTTSHSNSITLASRSSEPPRSTSIALRTDINSRPYSTRSA